MLSCLILATLLTNCAEVTSSTIAQRIGDTFDVTGQVLVRENNGDPILYVSDATGGVGILGVRHVAMPLPFKSGDTITPGNQKSFLAVSSATRKKDDAQPDLF